MNKAIWIVVTLVVLGGIAAFQLINQNKQPEQETIKIGAQLALTSFGVSWDSNSSKGALLAIEEINSNGGVLGRPLELLLEDNQSDTKKAVSATQKLFSIDKVDFLLTSWNDWTLAVVPLIDDAKKLTITVSAGGSDVAKESEYLFRTYPATSLSIKELVAYAQQKSVTSFAVINTPDVWAEGVGDNFEDEIKAVGGELKTRMRVQTGTQDFRSVILKLKKEKPEAIYVAVQLDSTANFLRQAHDLDLQSLFIYPNDLNAPEIIQDGANDNILEGVIYPVYATPEKDFTDAFIKKFGVDPGPSADTSYDAVYMLVEAIEKAQTTDSDAVRDALYLVVRSGASGQINFDEFGDRVSGEVIIKTYIGGQFVEVE